HYPGGYSLLHKVVQTPLAKLYRDSIAMAQSLQSQVRNSFELGSIGHILLDQGHKKKSLFVYSVNRDLFPTAANSWNGLARAYFALNKKDEASKALQKAVLLDPNNEESETLLREFHL